MIALIVITWLLIGLFNCWLYTREAGTLELAQALGFVFFAPFCVVIILILVYGDTVIWRRK